jgi:hypothetical protein
MRRVVVLALLLACGVAQAAEWVSVYRPAADGFGEHFIDVASIRIEEAIRRFRGKQDIGPHPPGKAVRFEGKVLSHTLSTSAGNCDGKTIRGEGGESYFTDGTSMPHAKEGSTTDWMAVPPGSLGLHILQFVCAWRPK